MLQLRPVWEAMCDAGCHTIFQNFDLNLLAARVFAGREEPCIVYTEASHGVTIIPAVMRQADGSLRLLGEELFDYRCFLHQGDIEVLYASLAVLAQPGHALEIVAVRENEAAKLPPELPLAPFSAAPGISRSAIAAEVFAAAHPRLARNLRRLTRLGFRLRSHGGDYSGLLRFIYEKKASQDTSSLFHDSARIEFIVEAAKMLPHVFEIFTLEDKASIAAAVVTLHDQGCRRFYTGWFAPELEKHSPALSLIYEVTRRSLTENLDCDYMTGEQNYKMRLATSSVPLYRLCASAEQLADAGANSRSEALPAA
jgi:CelD/BcsL family acetyltransferase involved in cellulose biosynthesis